jgi:uncharacterized membrane protein
MPAARRSDGTLGAATASMKRALQIILAVGLLGLSFSGYLSFGELFTERAGPSCPSVGEAGTVLGYPACVYGFFMYLGIVIVAAVGLRRAPRSS